MKPFRISRPNSMGGKAFRPDLSFAPFGNAFFNFEDGFGQLWPTAAHFCNKKQKIHFASW